MNKKLSAFAKLLLSCFALLVSLHQTIAQDKNDYFQITKEQLAQVDKIVRPAKDIVNKLLEQDKTGTYLKYEKDLKSLLELKDPEQKQKLSNGILKNYQSFFNELWEKAAIDEKEYQLKIREVFSPAMAEHIAFEPCLGFTIIISTPPPPAPEPAPSQEADKCIDVCPIAIGEVVGTSYLIGGGGGAYGNCFLRANAWGAVASFGEIGSGLKNNISIPGTFAADSRRLNVTVEYDLKMEATAFAVLGASMASASVSNGWTREYMMVFSPIIFAKSKIVQRKIQENFIVDKNSIAIYNISAGSSVLNMVISGSWGRAEATNIRWTICETK